LCIIGGAMLFGPVPLGRWVITVLTTLLAVYAGLLWLESEGPPLWAQLWLGALLSFSLWSVYLVHKRAA